MDKLAVSRTIKNWYRLSAKAKSRIRGAGVIRSRDRYATGMQKGYRNIFERAGVRYNEPEVVNIKRKSLVGPDKGKVRTIRRDWNDNYFDPDSMTAEVYQGRGTRGRFLTGTSGMHEAFEGAEKVKGDIRSRFGMRFGRMRGNDTFIGGVHGNPAVLGRESNMLAKIPYRDTSVMRHRQRSGEAGIIKGITGKRFGRDIIPASQMRKLRRSRVEPKSKEFGPAAILKGKRNVDFTPMEIPWEWGTGT